MEDENIGKKYGRLTVVSFSHKDKSYIKFYNCVCECGVEKAVRLNMLKRGRTKSCGCLQREMGLKTGERKKEDPLNVLESTGGENFARDCYWIYENIGSRDIKRNMAPNLGAYTLLKRIQKDGKFLQDFYRICYNKLFTHSVNKVEEAEERDDNAVRVERAIERIQRGAYRGE